jgi:glycerol-3-phosphate acyltransferase PlsY
MTPREWLLFVVFPLGAYVIGATPFGFLIGRAKGIDLRKQGSGNVGATNVGRVLGKTLGYTCFLLDVAKGLGPVLLVGMFVRGDGVLTLGEQLGWLGVGLGAILGHVFTFWLGFRGGKGVATSLGVVLGFWPYFTLPGLAAFALWIVVTLIWRDVSLGSIVAAVAFPVFFVVGVWRTKQPIAKMFPLLIFALAMATLVIVRHRSNIVRLLRGQENKI